MSEQAKAPSDEEQVDVGAMVASELAKSILQGLEAHANVLKMIAPQLESKTRVAISLTALGLAKSSLVAAMTLSGMVTTTVEEYMDGLAEQEKAAVQRALEKVAVLKKMGGDITGPSVN